MPAIQKLFNEYRLQSINECHEKFGWLDEQFMLKCREIINHLIENDSKNTKASRNDLDNNDDDNSAVDNTDEEDNELFDDSVQDNSYDFATDSSDSFTDYDYGYEDNGLNEM